MTKLTKSVSMTRTIKLFSPKEQPPSFDEVPEEFQEASMLFKEDKKANLESISILLSPYLKAQFDRTKYKPAKTLFAGSEDVIDADEITITEVKFVKKSPIPTISVQAVFKLQATDAYIKANEEDEAWGRRYGIYFAEAISIGWNIDHWGVEGLDLSLGDYKESGLWFESE
jgi:hypothetical protein